MLRFFPARFGRRRGLSAGAVLLCALTLLLPALRASAAETAPPADLNNSIRFVQIATGPTAGTYFPIGGLIANAISNPPGSRPCERGGSCGVPGLIAVAQSTNGSLANLDAIAHGSVDLGLSQADLAYWRYQGSGPFKGQNPETSLRGIAMLYPESVHLVARKEAHIASVRDLKGKRVSLGEEGSGTLVDAQLILQAYGVSPRDFKAEYTKPSAAADALINGKIDAFFFVAGAPVSAVSSLADAGLVSLVPLDGPPARKLAQDYPFLMLSSIPEGTYAGVPTIATLSVGALLVCSANLPDELVYGITAAIFHPNTRPLFAKGHPAAAQITLANASRGLGIPLHPGAERYYQSVPSADLEPPAQ